MFTEASEIFVWCTKNYKYEVYRLKLAASAKTQYVNIFNEGSAKIIYDLDGYDRDKIDFTANYKLNDDESFIINPFNLPSNLVDALSASDTVEPYIPKDSMGYTEFGYRIKAILIGEKNESGTYIVAGQKFSKNQILLKKTFNLFLDNDTFKKEPDKFSIAASEEVDCIFMNNVLAFNNYAAANKVFDLSEYYREASQEEIESFKTSSIFAVTDEVSFEKNVKGILIRKKIARILDMGTMQCTVDNLVLKASNVNIALQVAQGKILMPSAKKELKIILSFLAEEIYNGIITNITYMSNSNRVIE